MPQAAIDLRSDTVTRPTPAMRKAMAEAEVGDDVFGDDPTVIRLQALAARMLGKEAALFVPTGTMGNQVAIHVWNRPGDEILAEASSHIFLYELGAFAVFSGGVPRPLAGVRGVLSAAQLKACIRPAHYWLTRPGLVCVESTHNEAGGVPYPVATLAEIAAFAREAKLPVHLDGARIFNAAAALGVPAAEIARHTDSVMFCLSKGLSAPVGSILLGSADFIEKARRARKRMGGGMRQAGVIAAAGIVALETMVERMAEDHARARSLAEAAASRADFSIDPRSVPTNIVIFEVRPDEPAPSPDRGPAQRLQEAFRRESVLTAALGPHRMRLVTHADISESDVRRVCDLLKKLRF